MNLILSRLRDVPVLAKEAAHVASRRPHAEHLRPGKKMIQRFLFNGIDLQGRRRAVAQAIEFSVLIYADEAKPGLSRMDVAMARTQVAVHAPARLRLPPPSFVQLLRFLEDVQFAHERIPLPISSYAYECEGALF